jgi:hypothetical protein
MRSQLLKSKEQHLRVSRSARLSKKLKIVSSFRPSIEQTRKSRKNKAEVYKRASVIAKKRGIVGSYIGLAAAYAPDIYETFYPNITQTFSNCEKDRGHYKKLLSFTRELKSLYNNIDFRIYNDDIFWCLQNMQLLQENKFAIVDLDLMSCLATTRKTASDIVIPIIDSFEQATKNRFLLMLWSAYGMKVLTEKRYDKEVRPFVLKMLSKRYAILEHSPLKYCDNCIPIKAEIFALRKRKTG